MGALVIAAFVALLLFGLSRWPRIVRVRGADDGAGTAVPSLPAGPGASEPTPRRPALAWLAARSGDPELVARLVGLRTAVPAHWRDGRAGAATGLFVTPPLGRFVCAIGSDAWQRGDFAAIAAALRRLSSSCSEAFWFGIDERGDRFGWAMARDGEVRRAFGYDGEGPSIVWDEGEATVAEVRLGFFVDDPRDRSDDPIKWWPTAGDVRALAAAWSVDVTSVEDAPGAGLLGRW